MAAGMSSADRVRERFRIGVVGIDERADATLERLDGAMDAAPDLLSGDQGEKALNLIDPRGTGRREMDMPVRALGQPIADCSMQIALFSMPATATSTIRAGLAPGRARLICDQPSGAGAARDSRAVLWVSSAVAHPLRTRHGRCRIGPPFGLPRAELIIRKGFPRKSTATLLSPKRKPTWRSRRSWTDRDLWCRSTWRLRRSHHGRSRL
jgi:hypothetical protein